MRRTLRSGFAKGLYAIIGVVVLILAIVLYLVNANNIFHTAHWRTSLIGLLEEFFEILEVMGDKGLCRDLEEALKEFKEGKTRPLDDLIRELGFEGEV